MAEALRDFRFGAAQQSCELEFRNGIGDRGDGRECRCRVGADGDGDRKSFSRVFALVLREVERAAAVMQPAHDEPVTADHLLSINTDVAARFEWPPGDDQSERNQLAGVVRPAVLNGEHVEIDVGAFQHHLLAGRFVDRERVDRRQLAHGRQSLTHAARIRRELRQRQPGELVAQRAKLLTIVEADGGQHAPLAAENVAGERHLAVGRVIEAQRGSVRLQGPVADLGDLESRADGGRDPLEVAVPLEAQKETPKIVMHRPIFAADAFDAFLQQAFREGLHRATMPASPCQ